ncbi:D-alanyl-D-alanine carboxypeptidase/D-alanyl-D-alanine endopeptidase [Lentibacillus saliphilus]|uniref:D-alanyl-D-alanine carboxypeptidase/D-alanyl-D-alanine endopeptidase n=1 Tax=Lentibacillus saliphilus TaxID=2737028 RepID=UPI0031BAD831
MKIIYAGMFIILLFILYMLVPPNESSTFTDEEEGESVTEDGDNVHVSSSSNGLENRIEAVLNEEEALKGAIAGISIRSGTTGDIRYDHFGDLRLHPASNMKLLTGAAALSVLGEDYRFSTQLLTDGVIDEHTLKGNLYIKGKGDPTLTVSAFKDIALELKQKGITHISGHIIGDDTWYDNERLSRDLNWSDETYYYGAQISALTASPNEDFDAGSVIVSVHPQNEGESPSVKIVPQTNYVQIENQAITTNSDTTEPNVTIERTHGTNQIMITGEIPSQSRGVYEWVSVWDPTQYALDLFQSALQTQGVSWSGTVVKGKAPKNAHILFERRSSPLSELLVPFMKLSNNTIGEMLVKEIGRYKHGEGSWEKGLLVLEMEMNRMGMNLDTMLLRDGSGISHINMIPANDITSLLYTIQQQSWFQTFKHSLPVAGRADRIIGGTLRYRMGGFNVQAKTGTIYGVSTLSGYAETAQGEPIIFSILLNNLLDDDDGPDIQDKLIKTILNTDIVNQ